MLLGINANNHDASVALYDNSNILFAAHAERYSRIKNDKNLSLDLLDNCYQYGKPTEIIWSERPILKATRHLYSGERPIFTNPHEYLKKYNLDLLPLSVVPHHGAHAALGYYTSGYNDAAIIVIDAIGEWDTTSIWIGKKENLKCVWRTYYPHSIGLFYSAITHSVGLKPNEEEYILMGMAAYGSPIYVDELKELLFKEWNPPHFKVRHNMHRGVSWLLDKYDWRVENIAASAQKIYEEYLNGIVKYSKKIINSDNLVLSGGCALNCVSNNLIRTSHIYQNMYVPPNCGDGGLSMGSVLYKTKRHIKLSDAYLGHNISHNVDIKKVVDDLYSGNIVGIANGRAEYGPRALGNRSLLADPRGTHVKDRVNEIKQRQKFRPFAPVILEEYVDDYFYTDCTNYSYMQYAVKCRSPLDYPAICHVDGTSRVQTVNIKSKSIIRQILEAWYEKSGCPMLLNTSLNIRGEPLVNDWHDAVNFSKQYGVRVY